MQIRKRDRVAGWPGASGWPGAPTLRPTARGPPASLPDPTAISMLAFIRRPAEPWADGAPRHQPRSTRTPPVPNQEGVIGMPHSTSMHAGFKGPARRRNSPISGEPAAVPVDKKCGVAA